MRDYNITTDDQGNYVLTTSKGNQIKLKNNPLRVDEARDIAAQLDTVAEVTETIKNHVQSQIDEKLVNTLTQLRNRLQDHESRLTRIEEKIDILIVRVKGVTP